MDSKLNKKKIVLGKTEYGEVILKGLYGNKKSSHKIAYIIGIHPQEFSAHNAIENTIKKKDKSLKYSYYIYKIKVTKEQDNYKKGRLYGQLLANEFAVPHIIQKKHNLTIDVHSNQGEGEYSVKRFVFAPIEDKKSRLYAFKIIDKIPELVYYNPISQTSTQYVTIPLINAGIPAIVYETYIYDTFEITKKNATIFVNTVDEILK